MTKQLDITGEKFGRLTAIRIITKVEGRGTLWLCQCDCGKNHTAFVTALRSGNTKSCGCYHVDRARICNLKHGEGVLKKESKEYIIWKAMKQRCENSRSKGFIKYGARGITVCPRWSNFTQFLKDMGRCPEGMSIERKDNNGPYAPENCKWGTIEEQVHNKRNNVWLEYNGIRLIQQDWAKRLGVSEGAIAKRLRKGEPFEDIARRYLA